MIRLEIECFLARYQMLEIAFRPHDMTETRTVYVHVPYMMGTVNWMDQPETLARQRARHRARLIRVKQARADAPPEIRAFLQHWFYDEDGEERLVAKGRSNPEDIRQLLQAAVDQGLVPRSVGEDPLTGVDLRAWLQQYGIGVDCSAFVQHTLTHLLERSYAAVGDTPAGRQDTDVGWMLAATVYRRLVQESIDCRFELVATPGQARPGDILVSTGHSRIIIDAQSAENGARVVTLAESTSRTDLVGGTSFQADVGPRRYQVRYPDPDRAIQDQLPAHKRVSEAAFEFEPSEDERLYLIGRLKRLAGLRRRLHWRLFRRHRRRGIRDRPPGSRPRRHL